MELRKLRPIESADAVRVLTKAFAEEGHFSTLLPRAGRRTRTLRHLMSIAVRDAQQFGSVYGAFESGGRLLATAVFLPPGRYPMSPARQIRAAPRSMAMLMSAGPAAGKLLKLERALNRVHPKGPHWYLVAIGADPGARRLGAGSAVLKRGLEDVEKIGSRCYLETQKPSTADWYRGFGFEEVADQIEFDSFVSYQMMRVALGSSAREKEPD